jgi:hypothetical protein
MLRKVKIERAEYATNSYRTAMCAVIFARDLFDDGAL